MLTLLREIDMRLQVAARLVDIIRFRLLMITCGYEDGIDADSHYAAPEMFNLCRASGVDFILGLATNATLRAHVVPLEASTRARATGSDKVRRFTEFHNAARSWRWVERIIARVEAGPQGVDTRFIVTSLTGGRAKWLYEQVYCRRGVAENHIKSWKNHLAADCTSCTRATANQMRLMLHAGAYWLMWGLRSLMPRRSPAHRPSTPDTDPSLEPPVSTAHQPGTPSRP
ncbi:hypothetical protein GCM10011317_49350 [Niveispirillum cyanobacteriorum]|nr:hypothetical protein GCM10011317_49350 [Niveispirillum cyanobacteriorum]